MNWMKLKASLALAALSLVAALLGGCYSDPNVSNSGGRFVFPEDSPLASTGGGPASPGPLVPGAAADDFTKIRVGDFLIIAFSDVPNNSLQEQKIRVPQDGMITLPYNIKVKAIGRTTTELQEDIRSEYVPKYYVNLTATVKAEERFYFVGGEVRNSGRQIYLGEMTVTRAIDTAGGFTDFANRKKIELRRANGETLKVNWNQVRKNPKLDLQVFPNDHITVPKAIL
jgi:protein involved in polysaccharide export with SLBB domain